MTDNQANHLKCERLVAPWNQATVDTLNRYQKAGHFHPFTCGRRDTPAHRGDESILIATPAGWICPHCSYTQNWAHASMAQSIDSAFGHLDFVSARRLTAIKKSQDEVTAIESIDIAKVVDGVINSLTAKKN